MNHHLCLLIHPRKVYRLNKGGNVGGKMFEILSKISATISIGLISIFVYLIPSGVFLSFPKFMMLILSIYLFIILAVIFESISKNKHDKEK